MENSSYKVKFFPRNLKGGKDYVVGDIHGMYSLLQEDLDKIGFDPKTDRLFSCGDLVDRGPESADVLKWLDYDWFHAVRGNHDQLFIDYMSDQYGFDQSRYYMEGAFWIMDTPQPILNSIDYMFRQLPLAIVIDTKKGPVVICHGDLPVARVDAIGEYLDTPFSENFVMWSRDRIKAYSKGKECKLKFIEDAHRVYVGHSFVKKPLKIGNVVYIDTGACFEGGYFTIKEI